MRQALQQLPPPVQGVSCCKSAILALHCQVNIQEAALADFPTSAQSFFAGYTPPEKLNRSFCDKNYADQVRAGTRRRTSAKTQKAISLEDRMSKFWDVRDQRPRGTCTAFAVAACIDILEANSTRASQHAHPVATRTTQLHSAEYLYWHMRAAITPEQAQSLPDYAIGATKLLQAHQVLSSKGICREDLAPYQLKNLREGLYAQKPPSQEAEDDAAQRRFHWVKYQDFQNGDVAEDTADIILDELKQGRPVALGLPVFRLKGSSKTNWTYDGALNSGLVPDPVSRPDLVDATARSSGHCVCVTGFQPAPAQLGGGWFIFRNSWNGDFGKYPDVPLGGYPGIGRRGNGAVSFDYVNGYTVEYLSLVRAS